MYKSKEQIEKKLSQARFALAQLSRYEGRIFVNSGKDETTGAFPFIHDFSSFVTQTRSIFQYGLKEARELGMQPAYDRFVSQRSIVRFFADIRDSDIHESMPEIQMTLTASSPIVSFDPEGGVALGKQVSLHVESLEDLDSPKQHHSDFEVSIRIGKPVQVTPQLIKLWTDEQRADLLSIVEQGRQVLELLGHEGEFDIFKLSRSFLSCSEEFLRYGIEEGFIT